MDRSGALKMAVKDTIAGFTPYHHERSQLNAA